MKTVHNTDSGSDSIEQVLACIAPKKASSLRYARTAASPTPQSFVYH